MIELLRAECRQVFGQAAGGEGERLWEELWRRWERQSATSMDAFLSITRRALAMPEPPAGLSGEEKVRWDIEQVVSRSRVVVSTPQYEEFVRDGLEKFEQMLRGTSKDR